MEGYGLSPCVTKNRKYNIREMDYPTILAIIQSPPDAVVQKELTYFNRFLQGGTVYKYTTIAFEDMKTALIDHLSIRCDKDTPDAAYIDMDVQMICESHWNERAFSDTSPRDAIIGRLIDTGKIQRIRA